MCRYAEQLHMKYDTQLGHVSPFDMNKFDVNGMLGEAYPYLIQFAELLYLDLNTLIRWYIRYVKLM